MRQLTASNGDVTLAKSYDPYGVVTQAGGTSQSAYGYTGEAQDNYTNLVYLRARFYNPAYGRFQSRDTWDGSYNSPQSLNRWNYVQSNPLTYVDPTGRYLTDVHYDMTKASVLSLAKRLGYKEELAETIAWWDWDVDYASEMNFSSCTKCHFTNKGWARRTVELAIESGEPYLFGVALHQFQDTYSHYEEGYYGWHVAATFNPRTIYDYSDFYQGGHYTYNDSGRATRATWNESPYRFEQDPKENVETRNPGLVKSVSDLDRIDLYLRTDGWGDKDYLMKLREYFGYEVDLYISSSARDSAMKTESEQYIQQFVERLEKDSCNNFATGMFEDVKQNASAELLMRHTIP